MKCIGPHRLTNLNIIDPGVDELFSDGRKADILYCDPPWGDAAVKMFATLARKAGETVDVIPYDALVTRLFELIEQHVSGHAIIETGLRWQKNMMRRMSTAGLQNIEARHVVYGNRNMVSTIIFGTFTGAASPLSAVEGMKGGKVAELVVAQLAAPGGIVFDPCCGMGFSATAALAHGMEFRGNELSAARLAKTLKRLS